MIRPLWPGTDPGDLQDWLPLIIDLENFLAQQGLDKVSPDMPSLVGVGHSMGATITLCLALKRPELFSALVLIDPVLFPSWGTISSNILYRLGLLYQLHPLIKRTLRRRNQFESRQMMFESYRTKPVFSRLSDRSLWAYINSLACDLPDGRIQLCYSPQWEAQIYATGIIGDKALWKTLPGLRLPVLLLRGELSNTFWPSTARLFQQKLPAAQIITIPDTTHLLPLEAPEKVSLLIDQYLSGKVTNDT
jgi:pimeloyl-ACP methyl ester carboxylesterase